ncbi:hypothetical protein [Virgisporangium aurantiacum]|uniref:Uncharacterized protein n=1 Tax=Virgisporangium aurantiacum TaxID=175570 RepID=A0A8J3Z789_9ACTN|nr:hypothetical protein [Virgisporangium aurantiacum]GIJ56210.1 hypothetical protein Vau01_037260 [Virgisporangium aurantiacum]
MDSWYSGLIGALGGAILNWLTSATQAALNWVLGLLSGSVFSSPDVTGLPQVSYVSGRALLVANGFMVLVVMVVGVIAMTHGNVQERYSLKELLPRMLIGFLAANMATPMVRAAITGANAVTGALSGDRFTSDDAFTQIRRVILGSTTDSTMFVAALVLRELALWMLIGLVFTWLGRIAVLLVVAGTAPVALMCHALPYTEVVARLWWRSLVGVLLVQVLQAVTLNVAVATLLSSDANLPDLGLPKDPTGVLNILITCFVLWLVIRIPKWVARIVGGGDLGRGGSVLANIVRVVVVQQLLGAVGFRGGRLLGRRGAAAAAGPRAPANHMHANDHQHLHQHLHIHPPRPPRADAEPPRRGHVWVDRSPSARPHPGRPPQALEGRPTLPPATRRAVGPA